MQCLVTLCNVCKLCNTHSFSGVYNLLLAAPLLACWLQALALAHAHAVPLAAPLFVNR